MPARGGTDFCEYCELCEGLRPSTFSRNPGPDRPGSSRSEDPADLAAETPAGGPLGSGGMGRFDTTVFMIPGVPVAAVCDVDGR